MLPHLTKIINFDHYQVFKDATAYTAITFLQNEKTANFLYTENFKSDFNNLEYKKISAQHMRSERWEFFDEKYLDKIIRLNKKYSTLQEVANIHYGIATLKDDIYIFSPENQDKKYFYFDNFKIEKDICVPIIKASTYKGENQNLFLIFPYKNERVIPKNIFQKNIQKHINTFCKNETFWKQETKVAVKIMKNFTLLEEIKGLKRVLVKKS